MLMRSAVDHNMIDCMHVLPSAVEQSLWVLVGIWMKIPSRDPEPRAWSWITLRPTQNWKPSQQQLERSPLCLFCSLLSLSDLEAHRGMGSPCSSQGFCLQWEFSPATCVKPFKPQSQSPPVDVVKAIVSGPRRGYLIVN